MRHFLHLSGPNDSTQYSTRQRMQLRVVYPSVSLRRRIESPAAASRSRATDAISSSSLSPSMPHSRGAWSTGASAATRTIHHHTSHGPRITRRGASSTAAAAAHAVAGGAAAAAMLRELMRPFSSLCRRGASTAARRRRRRAWRGRRRARATAGAARRGRLRQASRREHAGLTATARRSCTRRPRTRVCGRRPPRCGRPTSLMPARSTRGTGGSWREF